MIPNRGDFLSEVDNVGSWQLRRVTLLWLPTIAAGILVILHRFTVLRPDAFRCLIPECEEPDSVYSNGMAVGNNPDDFCKKPVFNDSFIEDDFNCSLTSTLYFDDCRPGEDIILYDTFALDSTIVTEFDLVCENGNKVILIHGLFVFGQLFGSLLGAPAADVIGRKAALFIFILAAALSNMAGALVTNDGLYAFFRFVSGSCQQVLFLVAFVLTVEVIPGARFRGMAANLNFIAYAIGSLVTGLCSYLIRDWRNVHFATSALVLPQILLWPLFYESFRWLFTQKNWSRLEKVAKSCFKTNRTHRNKIQRRDPDHTNILDPVGWTDIVVKSELRGRTFFLICNWSWIGLVHGGLGIVLSKLPGDIFINYFATILAEILGFIFNLVFVDRLGRKTCLFVGYMIAAISCIVSGLLPHPTSDQVLAIVQAVFLLVGRLGSSSALATTFLISAELYPTQIRASALGTFSVFTSIFSILAILIDFYLPGYTFEELPILIFGCVGIIGAVTSLPLPETLSHFLPDDLREASIIKRKNHVKHFWTVWCSANKLKIESEKRRQTLFEPLSLSTISDQQP